MIRDLGDYPENSRSGATIYVDRITVHNVRGSEAVRSGPHAGDERCSRDTP